MTERVYLPLTWTALAAIVADRHVDGPFNAHAVTDAVRAEWADSGEEEWEYEALCLAADDCRELWSADDVRRRVVLALDVAQIEPVGAEDPTLVVVPDGADWSRVAAVHADLDEADALADDDLRWFGTQEVQDLLDATTPGP